MSPSRKPAVVRGFAAASLATFAALAGHVTGGGQMPGTIGILIPWVLSFMICVLLAGRKLSVIRLSASVAISQFLFHVLFVLGTIQPSGQAAGHVHGAPLVLPAATGMTEAVAADSTMWAGHLVAAIVTIAVAYRGERMLLALRALAVQVARWVRRRVDVVLGSPGLLGVRVLRSAPVGARVLESRILSTLQGRAPPVVHAI
jgi:hypothetical protein